MVLGNPRRKNKRGDHPSLTLDESEIKRVRKTKSLRAIIDETLGWKDKYNSFKGNIVDS